MMMNENYWSEYFVILKFYLIAVRVMFAVELGLQIMIIGKYGYLNLNLLLL